MNEPNAKKSYRTPKLVEHGNIRELTKAAGDFSKDGGPNARNSRT